MGMIYVTIMWSMSMLTLNVWENCVSSRYQILCEGRNDERRRFRSRHPGRSGRRGAPYPVNMSEFPQFADWLAAEVKTCQENSIEVPQNVVDSSKRPSLVAQKFRALNAYGNHYRVRSAELSLRTCDSGVAAVFRRPWRSGLRDQNPVEAAVEYVGHLHEILELDYTTHCVVILVCEWVKANYAGTNATVKKDRLGFTMANFNRMIPYGKESFAFPIHVQQVFLSNDLLCPGWKVVCRTEVRGRRIDRDASREGVDGLFGLGCTADHKGLQAPVMLPEEVLAPLPTGRQVQRQEIMHPILEEENPLFDRDLGESSEEE